MKYRVRHRTEYYYGDPVPLCHNLIHMVPRETPWQHCESSELSITPAPAARRDFVDFFGNHATWVSVQEPHEVLRVETSSEVEVDTPQRTETASSGWNDFALRLAHDPSLYLLKEYTFASRQVELAPELAEYARETFDPGRPLLDCVEELTRRIFDEFQFDSTATTINTPVLEVLDHRRGVCQDFAHLEIGCLRSLGLPARYVSGYFATQPPPGQKRIAGADRSHAWVSTYLPELGWVDVDPSKGTLVAEDHITIGWARDYDDVSPLRGVVVGGRRHSMVIGVDVEPLESPAASGEPFSDG
ncbi:MAG TPA: transglutaminase family protein [Pirellulales bacterium]|nr:transglutaminase family protein [Pirellulales bacterium]